MCTDIKKNFASIQDCQEARENDSYTICNLLVPASTLVELAGYNTCQYIIKLLPKLDINPDILILVGPGNNGADGLACARHLLSLGFLPKIFTSQEITPNLENQFQQNLINNLHKINFYTLADFALNLINHKNLILIDALLGSGISRAPQGDIKRALKLINLLKNNLGDQIHILSIDTPSGYSLKNYKNYDPCIKACATITFGAQKTAHLTELGGKLCGTVYDFPIGQFNLKKPTKFLYTDNKLFAKLINNIKLNSHKNIFGHVGVFEGHPNMLGASRLAARAALRVGSGLVTILQNKPNNHASDLPEFMKKSSLNIKPDFYNKLSALVIGPGLSQEISYQKTTLELISKLKSSPIPIILDADGLELIKNKKFSLNNNFLICTPHYGEAAKIIAKPIKQIMLNPFEALLDLGKITITAKQKIIWVLKGPLTLVLDPDKNIFAFRGYQPLLATGGSGDILAGSIAGLIAQTQCLTCACLCAISLQIYSANLCAPHKNMRGILPHELCDNYPNLLTRKLDQKIR